jgi:hypothetical protein
MWTLHCHASVSKREQDGLREIPSQGLGAKIRGSQGVREGRVELPRPFGHRILRLLLPSTDPGAPFHPVSAGVAPCRRMSFRREQAVSKL